jgi:hypothetical protein
MATPQQQLQPPQLPPPQPRTAAPAAHSVEECLGDLDKLVLAVRREFAAGQSYYLALLTVQGRLPAGARPRGLPILEFSATATGRDAVDCVSDLKCVDPQYIVGVLGPLADMHRRRFLVAMHELRQCLGETEAAMHAEMHLEPQPNTDDG